MFDRLVEDGDSTSTGGVVFGYSDFLNEEGNAYARKENKATCGNCKGAWPIYGTDVPYRVRFGSEVVASRVTDSQGMTQRIATDAAKRLVIEIAGDH